MMFGLAIIEFNVMKEYAGRSVARIDKQEAQGPHRSPESSWLIFRLWTHATLLFFIAIRSHCQSISFLKAFMLIWPILAWWFWKRRFLNEPTPFLWLSPLWRGSGLLFEQFKTPCTQGWFMPSLVVIGLLVLDKKISI
jgi:hypothetical protein